VRDFAALPSWRTDLKSVELLPPRNGGRVRITERGFVKYVLFRFLARFAFGFYVDDGRLSHSAREKVGRDGETGGVSGKTEQACNRHLSPAYRGAPIASVAVRG
jgi:hypothetical protein